MLAALFQGVPSSKACLSSVRNVRLFAGSLHLTLEPVDGQDNEGIFYLTLTRPEAKNAIGTHRGSVLMRHQHGFFVH